MSTLFLEYTLSDYTTLHSPPPPLPGPPPPSWKPHPECPSLLINNKYSLGSGSGFPALVVQKALRDPDTGEVDKEPLLASAVLVSSEEGSYWKIDKPPRQLLPYHTPPPPRFQFHTDPVVVYQHSFKTQPYGDELRDITNRPEEIALHDAITIDSLPTDHFWAGEPDGIDYTPPLTEQEITEMAEEFYSVSSTETASEEEEEEETASSFSSPSV